MDYKKTVPLGWRIFIIMGIVVICYQIFSLATSIYNDYQVDQNIEKFKAVNRDLELEKKQKQKEYLYALLRSSQEKLKKENFGEVFPGEQVIIVPEIKFANPLLNIVDEEKNDLFTEGQLQNLTNLEKWGRYLWGRR
ncbi:hypothetical protein COT40_01080 [Candidatus Peregrinibacteria bacterium CG08_land_8_20_14_0_20_41_10]|nr:MAG: hypothetical protein AUJ78_01565 [Candidatus Peregrinibacteria bacterium CG1_02_41_10]PIS32245.1 MAG: hypothetical protein COT40_01080 [Candidatus Peregrinibacteria bacterium CG08_land_8_20_14_0_20_41_10]